MSRSTTGHLQATRVALLNAIIEDFETRWLAGEQIELSSYLYAVNVQRNLLSSLERLQRKAKRSGLL
jgi:hypothetical protein